MSRTDYERASRVLKKLNKAWRRVADAEVAMSWKGCKTEEEAADIEAEHTRAAAALVKVCDAMRGELRHVCGQDTL